MSELEDQAKVLAAERRAACECEYPCSCGNLLMARADTFLAAYKDAESSRAFLKQLVVDLGDERDSLQTALRRIASYNSEELREWGEDNAADMVEIARRVVGSGN